MPRRPQGRLCIFGACLKIRRGSVFEQKAGWQGATRENILGGSSTDEQQSQTVFCPWPALAHSLQPAAGMLGTRRLGHRQNPSPQDPSQFSDRLLDRLLGGGGQFDDPAQWSGRTKLDRLEQLVHDRLAPAHVFKPRRIGVGIRHKLNG